MSYNGFGLLASKRVEDPVGLNILSQLDPRSLTGSIHTKETDNGTWSYLYDLTGQLTNDSLVTNSTSSVQNSLLDIHTIRWVTAWRVLKIVVAVL